MEEYVGFKSTLSKKPLFNIGSSAYKSRNAFENSTLQTFALVIPVGLRIPVSVQ